MTPAESLFREAAKLQREGRRAEAIERFREALNADPSSAERWYEFGYLLKAAGQYQPALDAFDQALKKFI